MPLLALSRLASLLITVPAYQWLWSGHDEINHHFRRYTRRSLQRAGEAAAAYGRIEGAPRQITARFNARAARETSRDVTTVEPLRSVVA